MRRLQPLLIGLVALVVTLSVVPTASAEPIDTTSTGGYRIQTVPPSVGGSARVISDNGIVALFTNQTNKTNRIWPGIGYPFSDIGCQNCASNPNFNIADVNSSDVFAGSWINGTGLKIPFVWSESAGYNQLGLPTGSTGIIGAEVKGIDEAGNIAGIFNALPGVCDDTYGGTCSFFGSPDSIGGYDLSVLPGMVSATNIGGGRVVGNGWTWTPGGGMVDLMHPGYGVAVAYDINESGEIAGILGDGAGNNVAAYWPGPTASPIPIGTLSGDSQSFAAAINGSGQVVGWSGTSASPNDPRRAFAWTPPSGPMVDLGLLPGGTTAEAWDINFAGLVAGTADGRPVIWDFAGSGYDIDYPPEVMVNAPGQGSEGDLLVIDLTVTDFDGDPFTVTLSGEPAGAVWDDASQDITWQTGTGDAGTHQFTMTVTQVGQPANTITVPMVFRVSGPITLDPIGDQTATEGQPLTFTAMSSAGVAQYAAFGGTPSNPTPLPTGAQIDPFTGVFTWTPDSGQVGDHEVTIQVTDIGDRALPTASETITISVQPAGGTRPVTIMVDESILVIDDPSTLPAALIQLIEGIRVADDVQVHPPVLISVFENVGVSDGGNLDPSAFIQLAESVAVGDAVVVSPEALASLSGTKWEDIDGNGVPGPGEPPVEGVSIYLDLNDDGTLDSGEPTTVTAADGSYTFEDLVPGLWVVREVVPQGYTQTFPAASSGFEHRVTLTPGEVATGLDFGNQAIPNLAPTIQPIDDVFAVVGEQIVVSPVISDPEGDQLTHSWDGAPANAIINGIFVLTATADQGGSVFEITLTVAQVDDPSNTTSESFHVYVAALPAVQGEQPQVSPTVAPPGGDFQVGGDGFAPGSEVGIYLFSDPVLLGRAGVDGDGAFTTTVTLPDDIGSGSHQILVMGLDADGSLRTLVGDFTVSDDADNDGLTAAEEALTGTDPGNPDSDGDGLIDGLDATWLIEYLDSLPNSAFKRAWQRGAMKLTVGGAAFAVRLGAGDTALAIMSTLHERIDGCGTSADGDDWIVDCVAQLGFRELLTLYERGVENLPLPNPFPW